MSDELTNTVNDNQQEDIPATDTNTPVKPKNSLLKDFGMSMIPFVPAPFTGNKALYSYLRLGIYGIGALMTFEKSKKLSYLLMGCTGVSLATSLSADALKDVNDK